MVNSYITKSPYSEIDIKDCIWYHSYEFNRNVEGVVREYGLHPVLNKFLLPENMEGKTFLDIGTASGFFSFEMERRGAEVVSFDLGLDDQPDQIPYPNALDRTKDNREFFEKLHKSYWYAHRYFNSKARVVYGSVMRMPDWLGEFDVTILGSILQHLRDPLGAIIEADRHTNHTLILCEAYYKSKEPVMCFQADPEGSNPQYWTWWKMSSSFLVMVLRTLGYKNIEVCGPFNLYNLRGNYEVPTITIRGAR